MLDPHAARRSRPAIVRRNLSRRWRGLDNELVPRAWRGTNGRPGFVDELANRYPRLAAWRDWRHQAVGSADWVLHPCGTEDAPETPREESLRLLLQRIVFDELVANAAQKTPSLRGSFRTVMQRLATRDEYGCSAFERTWWTDRSAWRGLRLELFWLHPSTINDWIDDDSTGALHSVLQVADGGSQPIEADRLFVFPYGAADGEYEGWTRWRSLGLLVELAWQCAISYGVTLRRQAGILTIEETEDARWGTAETAIIDEFLDEVEEGTTMSGRLPKGTRAAFLSLASSASLSPVEFWKYVDSTVDHVVHQHADSLGVTAGTGSRALGETFEVKEGGAWARHLEDLGAVFAESVFAWIADELGFDGCRLPGLGIAEESVGVAPAERRSAVLEGVQNGWFSVTPELTRELGAEAGLSDAVIASMIDGGGRRLEALSPEPAEASSQRESLVSSGNESGDAAENIAEGEKLNGAQIDAARSTLADVRAGVLPAAAALELLVAVGIEQARAERMVGATAAMPALSPEDSHDTLTMAAHESCCSGVRLAERPRVDVVDVNGESFSYHRELHPLERQVAWNEISRRRNSFDEGMEAAIAGLVSEHRADLVEAIDGGVDDGLDEAELDELIAAVRADYTDRYRDAIEAYVVRVEQLAEREGRAEAARQEPGEATDGEVEAAEGLTDWASQQLDALRRGVDRQAETIARRVEADIVDGWGATAIATRAADIEPRVTVRGLVADVKGLGNRAESAGRVIEAALGETAADLVPVESFRNSVRDGGRCAVCFDRDGLSWPLDSMEGMRAFLDDRRAICPDPECEGGVQRCRCGHLLRYARRPADAPPRELAGIRLADGRRRPLRTLADLASRGQVPPSG